MDELKRFRLDGRVVLVAGGSGGIGSRACAALAGVGADVAIVGQADDRMRQAAAAGTEAAEGVAIAQELVEAVRPFAQGIVVSGARPDLVFPVIARTLSPAQIR